MHSISSGSSLVLSMASVISQISINIDQLKVAKGDLISNKGQYLRHREEGLSMSGAVVNSLPAKAEDVGVIRV